MSHLHASKKVGSEEIFNFPMLHIASHFCVFSRIFQSFLTLSKQKSLHFLGGFSKIKTTISAASTHETQMKTIFANYLNLHIIKLKYRYLKVLHKILQNFQSKHSINHHDLTLFETKLRKKPSRGVGKYRCLEKGALKIFRKYIQDPAKPLR